MKINHVNGYFGPPPRYCFCCGARERTSGCVRGFTCGCEQVWPLSMCKTCHKCKKHCQCPIDLAITLPAFFAAVSLFAKAAVLESAGEV